MFRRTERAGGLFRPRGRSTILATRWGLPAVSLVALCVMAPSGSAIAASATVTASGIVHDPVQIESSSRGVVTSTNWSGYADTGASFTSVIGTWVQPTASCPTNQQQDASFWVGIDGFLKSSGTVEQIGTDSDCNKGNKKFPGGPSYYAWWEMFPQASNNLSTKQFPVFAGDTISAQVTASGTTFTLTINDVSRGWSFSPGPQTASAAESSAEWIAEAPSICRGSKCTPVKLAAFGTVSFTGAAANGSAISASAFSDNQINMTKGKKTLKASASALSGGSAFSVTWHHN